VDDEAILDCLPDPDADKGVAVDDKTVGALAQDYILFSGY
jgi:hypothetical protein